MTTFAPKNFSARLDYTDNANTSVNLAIPACGAVAVFTTADVMINFGTANTTAANYYLADGDSVEGIFLVTGYTVLSLPNFKANSGPFYISASSDTVGYIIVTPGALD